MIHNNKKTAVSNCKYIANIQLANRVILAFFSILILTSPLTILPTRFSILIFTLSNVLLIRLFFRQAILNFVKDTRFRTSPGLFDTLILTILYLAINIGLTITVFGAINNWLPALSKYIMVSSSSDDFSDTFSKILSLFSIGIITPLYEEFVFRGIVLRAYEKARSPLFAAIITSFLFALAHVSLIQLIPTIFSSFILSKAVQHKESWWLGVIAHTSNNIIVLIYVFFTGKTINIETVSLFSISIIALILAIIAFIAAIFWLRTLAVETSIVTNKQEKIWTPSLITFFCLTGVLLVCLPYLQYLSTK